jgi:cell division protein FtsN
MQATPPFQILGHFEKSRYIVFAMYQAQQEKPAAATEQRHGETLVPGRASSDCRTEQETEQRQQAEPHKTRPNQNRSTRDLDHSLTTSWAHYSN